jgi:hypothetical protein
VSVNINLFTASPSNSGAAAPLRSPAGTVPCPSCGGDVAPGEANAGWQSCPYCEKRLQIRAWPVIRNSANAAAAMPDQATCFFHPDKAFQACCQRCGRFVCALCDLQLGAEHVCPTCFERGRVDTGLNGGKAEWRHRDVLYDSIAMTMGWGWILVWPTLLVALPTAISLHVKYRKAPRSYLIPRRGWRFWWAYVGFAWAPLLIGASIFVRWLARRH